MTKFIVIQEDLNESYGPFLNEEDAYDYANKVNGIIVPLNQIGSTLTEAAEPMTKTEIKEFIRSEIERFMTSAGAKSIIESELKKMISRSDIKEEMLDVTKDFTKKFYRELALNASYVIDRIR